ncbi:tetratricopeptide repeat protein [Cryptosporangium phraense]|uniref:Tetratricopeptide repeat protein n=1 Tax=Cryptosporangium phraense TaxID=2593070 RepID=A0A545AZU7_9ACTN|nr:tetratricopeptide repeat protein [Cryptosporangium phraense]TQS46842.1 tetratricopeptide repeat protein [Cryptosporangium phraense]
MAFWRRTRKTTEHVEGDYGRADITVTEQPGDVPVVEVDLVLNAETARGLDFESKRERLGLDHPDTRHALHLYAVTIGDDPDRRDDAVQLLSWLADARADDPENRLLTLNDLTRLLADAGELAVAEQRLREALTGWEDLRGRDDPQTLTIASNLANTLTDLDRRDEAEGLIRDTVTRLTRTLGAGHPDTLRARNTLAGTLRGSPARLAEAEQIYVGLVADADEGADVTLAALHNLGAVYAHQGKFDEAREAYGRLIERRARHQGDDHPDTWRTRHNHAVVLNLLERPAEAESEMTDVLDAYRRLYGREHPATMGVQVDLAALLANRGANRQAVPLVREALGTYRRTHGAGHPMVRELDDLLRRLTAADQS